MKKLIDLIQEELVKAFTAAEMDPSYARVSVSNRPDLCEYQCNGAMAAAKAYHKAPIQLAEAVVEKVTDHSVIGEIEAVKPGFINLKINPEFLADYLSKMQNDEDLSVEKAKNPKTIIVDYGGANVAKPLHVGHLRSAIIGESIKRMGRFMGHNMIGDVHLGDWGLQMGLIITELQERHPELVYFDESFTGEYPEEAPFTISELESFWQLLMDRLLDHTLSGKSGKCSGLSQYDVPKHRKACHYAACCRIRQHTYVEQSCLTVSFNGSTRFCHLHQG